MMRYVFWLASLALMLPLDALAQGPGKPIIDVHLHAMPFDAQGPYPAYICAAPTEMPAWDPASQPYGAVFSNIHETRGCSRPIASQPSDEALMERTLEVLEANNIFAVTGGPLAIVERWREAAPRRIIPSLGFRHVDGAPPPEEIVSLFEQGRIAALGEVTLQYRGIEPDDPRFEPWLAMLAEHQIPMGIHIGTGPPGAPHLGFSNYRARMHSPLSLEEPLMKHPTLRVYVMHAGWPMLDDTMALLWTHPQVYVEVGVLVHFLPRPEFHRYLRTLVEAGFGNRVMFGSDQMAWPETIEVAIETIETADYLSESQKRDIFYNNAARFFRFSDEQIAAHHAL